MPEAGARRLRPAVRVLIVVGAVVVARLCLALAPQHMAKLGFAARNREANPLGRDLTWVLACACVPIGIAAVLGRRWSMPALGGAVVAFCVLVGWSL
jgi:hypothetical protein